MAEMGREEHWNFMWQKYLNEPSPSQRPLLMRGLAQIRIPTLIQRYLEYAQDETKIRSQDFFNVLKSIAENPIGRPYVWNFLREKWPYLVDRFTLNDRYLGSAVKTICSYFTSEDDLRAMKQFFSKYPEAGAGKRKREQALETVQNNIKWIKSYKDDVKTYLEVEGVSPWYYHRLPPYTVPKHYELLLHPKLEEEVFNGTVTITIDLLKPRDSLVVHVKNLNVTKSNVHASNGDSVEVESVSQYEENDYLVLRMDKRLEVGEYKLYFEFEGPLKLSLIGFYKSSYVDPVTMERKYLATTHFEPNYARQMFPCLDEPAFRSTFNVSVIHESKYVALSNTPEENTMDIGDGWQLTKFETTLPMVTYLLAIVVAEFDYIETITEKGVTMRTYAAPHLIEKTKIALEEGSKILTFYDDYFGIPFPLKKLDMVAIPDFGSNGMENWGLILYSENSLVVDNSSNIEARFNLARIVAHELAHMWFGDLVTMTWWSDLWLNEGFASFIALKGTKLVEPEIFQNDDEGIRELTNAMMVDQSINSETVVRKVVNIDSRLFNIIVYDKGCSVLRMLENFMGEDFRKGVSAYLKKYSLGNARTDMLWDELSNVSKQGLNVSVLMDTWTSQANYPYLSVGRKDLNHTHDLITVRQKRFLLDPQSYIFGTQRSQYNYVWQIPLTFQTSSSPDLKFMLLNSSEAVNVMISKSDWTKFNVNFTGYYSVNYDQNEWRRFSEILQNNREVLSPTDRANLIFDAFHLAKAGLLGYDTAFNLTQYMRRENYHLVWSLLIQQISDMDNLLKESKEGREIRETLKEHIRKLTLDIYKNFTWEEQEEDFSRQVLKKKILDIACKYDNQECLTTAGRLFKEWMKSKKINSELRRTIFEYGLRGLNNEESWNYAWNQYLKEQDPAYKEDLLYALAKVRSAPLLERLMQYAKNDSLVRKHNYFSVLKNIAQNPKGMVLVYHLVSTSWDNLTKTYGEKGTERLVSFLCSLFATENNLSKVKELYKRHKHSTKGSNERTLSIEKVNYNINWIKLHQNEVKNWLNRYVYMPWKNIRLPTHIIPVRYNITLHPNINQRTFEGSEEIEINVTQKTDYILVHELGLTMSKPELRNIEENETVPIVEAFPYKKNEFFVMLFKKEVQPGSYVLRFNFFGKFVSDGYGMARHEYKHRETKKVRYLLATQFEPTNARKVFPCFDEPAMKATFILNVIHSANHNAVSNMPVEKTIVREKTVTTVFEESVKMSTYLLTCVVSDFKYLEAYSGKTKVRAFAPPDRLHEAEHGLNLTVNILKKLEEFFGVPYTLPKLDSVAIPNHSVPGMEHWGAVTYSTRRFLYNGSLSLQRRVVEIDRVIAHELVHQWFGNLVTMKWWNDIWLSEGISTMIMYMPLKEFYPSVEEVHVRKMSKVMCSDSSTYSRAILRNVSSRNEIDDLFDSISYRKAGTVIKMLQHILQDDFRKGLSNFLKKYAYKNAETKDLWAELSKVTNMNIDIPGMMDTWTQQMGFPYVELSRHGSMLTATQHWFLRNMNDSSAELLAEHPHFSTFRFIWKIPLVYKNLATGNEHTLWLNEKQTTFEINAIEHDIIKFNPEFLGFYIVKYDNEDWDRIGQRLMDSHLDFSTTDRYNLLHDAFLLAETDRLVYDVPLELSKYLKKEKEALPWNLFRDHFLFLVRKLEGIPESVTLLKKYVQNLTSDLYDEFVFPIENNSHFVHEDANSGSCSYTSKDLDFITVIMDLACHTLNKKCVDVMHQELNLWMLGLNTTVDMVLAVDVAVPQFGNASLWNLMHEKILADGGSLEEKLFLGRGLSAFSQPEEISKTIEIMMNSSIDLEVARYIFQRLANNPKAMPILWNYFTDNYTIVHARLGFKNSISIGLPMFCDLFKTREHETQYKKFIHQTAEAGKYTLNCEKEMEEAISWTERHAEILRSWLDWNVQS